MSTDPQLLHLLLLLSLLLSARTASSLTPPAATSPTKPPTSSSATSPTESPPSPAASPTKSPKSPISHAKSPPSPAASPAESPPSAPGPDSSPSPSNPSAPLNSSSTLDPKQLRALRAIGIPTKKDPCSLNSSRSAAAVSCDSAAPFRHVLSLRLSNCSSDVQLSSALLRSLSTLRSLSLFDCPRLAAVHLPSALASSLRSFSAVHSLRKVTGVWLSRLQSLTDLTVSDVLVNASGPAIILANKKLLRSLTITGANLTGKLPSRWHSPNLTHLDLSNNRLRGNIPGSLISQLEDLQLLNLSSNSLAGEIPDSIGDLLSLRNLSLASNSLSGKVPDTISAVESLVHLDLSSNQFNGTIPRFLSGMKELKYLNLQNNSFHGVVPFNGSFIERLAVFKVGDNSNLCYNHTTLPSKMKLGIAPCDKHGLPLSPPAAKDTSSSDDTDDGDDDSGGSQKTGHHRGPNKVVLGVAIALSSIIFLIVFLVLLSKCCK